MDDPVAAVEARIATELQRVSGARRAGLQVVPPAPYLRRHLAEHAAAGDVLGADVLRPDFVPFLDATRLRPLVTKAITSRSPGHDSALLDSWRRAAHAWTWDSPPANADALAFWSVALPCLTPQSADSGRPSGSQPRSPEVKSSAATPTRCTRSLPLSSSVAWWR